MSKDINNIIVLVSDKIRPYLQQILRQFKIKVPVIGNSEINTCNVKIKVIKNI